jgi:hypothetical protein
MSNLKKQNKPAKRTTAKRALRSVAKFATQTLLDVPAEHDKMLTGLTDPFSDEAAEARYPDAGAGSTLCQRSKATTTFVCDANGAAAQAWGANFSFPQIPSSAVSGTTVTWAAAKTIDWSSTLLMTYGHYGRPTSFGIRLVCTLSATDSSGYLVIAKGGPPVLGGTTSFSPLNFSTYEMHPIKHGGEWHATLRPRSSAAYELTQVAAATNTQQANPYWETVYIGVFGCKASSSPLFCEVIGNYEYSTLEDAAIASLAVPQPILNIPMQTAINQVNSDHNGIHVGGKSEVKNAIKKVAKKALVKHVLPFAVKKGKQLLL